MGGNEQKKINLQKCQCGGTSATGFPYYHRQISSLIQVYPSSHTSWPRLINLFCCTGCLIAISLSG